MRTLHPAVIVAGVLGGVLMVTTRKGAATPDMAKVERFARAIAFAEGFPRPGAVPTRNNNPGDLKSSGVAHAGADAQGHLIFATLADGWQALRAQLLLIVDGGSHVYTLDMTIEQMATHYAEGAANWAANVSANLGVSPMTTLRALLT